MIYFGKIDEDGPIKVGATIDLKRRLAEHKAKLGVPLQVFATMPGDSFTESSLRRYLWTYTSAPEGAPGHEWLAPHPEIDAFVQEFTTPYDGVPFAEPRRRCYWRRGQRWRNLTRREHAKLANRMKRWFRERNRLIWLASLESQ